DPPPAGPAQLGLVVADDRGGRYAGRVYSGAGGGGMWRGSYLFTPPLDPAARELRVEVGEVRWWATPGEPAPEGVEPNDIVFTVSLRPAEDRPVQTSEH